MEDAPSYPKHTHLFIYKFKVFKAPISKSKIILELFCVSTIHNKPRKLVVTTPPSKKLAKITR